MISRRRFASLSTRALTAIALAPGCRVTRAFPNESDGRLAARPRAGVSASASGQHALGLDPDRDAILQMPANVSAPVPLLLLLHGAGGSGDGILRRVGSAPADAGVAVLAPSSRDQTWDAIRGGFGGDVAFLDRALRRVFDTAAIDPARVAVGGFSDGATYALALGLINGDLFSRIVAFSPGFLIDGATRGRPQLFISHGTRDTILPIDQCSRTIVPALQTRGYDVTFREFDGPHTVPPDIARDAMAWIRR